MICATIGSSPAERDGHRHFQGATLVSTREAAGSGAFLQPANLGQTGCLSIAIQKALNLGIRLGHQR